jgi:hypothetical protein
MAKKKASKKEDPFKKLMGSVDQILEIAHPKNATKKKAKKKNKK